MRSACCILLTLATATSVNAFDTGASHQGGRTVSGDRRVMTDDPVDRMLLETNNDLATPEVVTDATAPGGDRLSPQALDEFAIGHLLDGSRDTKQTYDRLVAQRVLQVIGFIVEPLYSTAPPRTDATATPGLVTGLAVERDSDASHRSSQVPEPTAASALVLGLAVLTSRRLGRPATRRGPPT